MDKPLEILAMARAHKEIPKFWGQKMNPSNGRNWYCVPKTPIRYNRMLLPLWERQTILRHLPSVAHRWTSLSPPWQWRWRCIIHILMTITSHRRQLAMIKTTNTICEHNIPDILFLCSFNLNSTCSARGNVSYLFFFLHNKHTTFYGRLHVLFVSTIW